MTALSIQPMQWSRIPTMGSEELEPFSLADAACFREIRDVLARHNALHRFGVFLIHKHFDIADDETLTEFTDEENRKLTITPIKKGWVDPAEVTPTNWIFSEKDETAIVVCTCAKYSGGHLGYHRKSAG
ncbi:hypothetical protein ACPA2M_08030 [Ectopseudomonas chengduensis]